MKTIKFSHRYEKMPKDILTSPTMLMAVFNADTKELGELFTKYDTLYFKESFSRMENGIGFYPLPKGKIIILLLITFNHVWTTIRRWTSWKEKYYRNLIGQDVHIEISENKIGKKD